MTTLVLSCPPARLKGTIKNSLLEISPNVFIGNPSKRIRTILWKQVIDMNVMATIAYSDARLPIGFVVESTGNRPPIIEKDGLYVSVL